MSITPEQEVDEVKRLDGINTALASQILGHQRHIAELEVALRAVHDHAHNAHGGGWAEMLDEFIHPALGEEEP